MSELEDDFVVFDDGPLAGRTWPRPDWYGCNDDGTCIPCASPTVDGMTLHYHESDEPGHYHLCVLELVHDGRAWLVCGVVDTPNQWRRIVGGKVAERRH